MSAEWINERWFSLVGDALLKSVFVFALAGLALLALRRAAAAARHLVWLLSLVGILGLPLLSVSLPSWRSPAWSQVTAVPEEALPTTVWEPLVSPAPPAPTVVSSTPPAAPRESLPADPVVPRLSPVQWAFAIWLLGVFFVFAPFVLGLGAIAWYSRFHTDRAPSEITERLPRLQAQLGVRGTVPVLLGKSNSPVLPPLTWGWPRAQILLPHDAAQWSNERLDAVLLHELAHIRRRDWLWQSVAQIACALWWFHPLAWVGSHQLRTTSERAADDHVLLAGIAPTDYAEHLLEVARSLRSAKKLTAAVPMARTAQIENRLKAVLHPTTRRAVSRTAVLRSVLLATAVLVALAVVRQDDSAQRDASTPAAQKGFTLLRVTNDADTDLSFISPSPNDQEKDATALIIRSSEISRSKDPHVSFLNTQKFKVTATTSLKDVFPLKWTIVALDWNYVDNPDYALAVYVPRGYPDTVRFLDVRIQDDTGNQARWRIKNLPRSVAGLKPPIQIKDTHQVAGMKISIRAKYRPLSEKEVAQGNTEIPVSFWTTGKPNQPHHWEIKFKKPARFSWMSPYELKPDGTSSTSSISLPEQTPVLENLHFGRAFYAQYQTHLQINGFVHQYDTYQEKLVFRNVPVLSPGDPAKYKAQTLVTPSGVRLTLHEARSGRLDETITGFTEIKFTVNYADRRGTLPRSPFYQKWKKPVTLQLFLDRYFENFRTSSGGTSTSSLPEKNRREVVLYLSESQGVPKVLPVVPIVIEQRVDLQSIPVSFTVPIEKVAKK